MHDANLEQQAARARCARAALRLVFASHPAGAFAISSSTRSSSSSTSPVRSSPACTAVCRYRRFGGDQLARQRSVPRRDSRARSKSRVQHFEQDHLRSIEMIDDGDDEHASADIVGRATVDGGGAASDRRARSVRRGTPPARAAATPPANAHRGRGRTSRENQDSPARQLRLEPRPHVALEAGPGASARAETLGVDERQHLRRRSKLAPAGARRREVLLDRLARCAASP